MAESKNQNPESDSFSQDDIDQLLRAADGDDPEGPEKIDDLLRNISHEESAPDHNGEEGSHPPEDLTPDDIQSLLNTALAEISLDDLEADLLQSQSPNRKSADSVNPDPTAILPDEPSGDHADTPLPEHPETAGVESKAAAEPEAAAFAGGDFSQDDIDKLLAADIHMDAPDAPQETEPDMPSEPGGEISQDDIDKLLAADIHTDAPDAPQETKPDMPSEPGGEISQDDIDKLLAADIHMDAPDAPQETEPDMPSEPGGEISQDDIDKLLSGEAKSESIIPEEPDALPQEEERSLFISQNELDQLLEEYDSHPPDGKGKEETKGKATDISQNDIDMLLSTEADDAPQKSANPEEGLISQDDIDNLLKGSDEEKETEEESSSLISQEDIDLLLKGVGEDSPEDPAETVEETADTDLPDGDGSGLVSQDDIDALLRDEVECEDVPVDTAPQIELDRVVLEEDDDTLTGSEEDQPEAKNAGAKKWYRSKLLIACSIGAFIFLVSSISLFLLLSGDEDVVMKPEMAVMESETLQEAAPVVEAAPTDLSVAFNDFIILAPMQRDDISILKADIQVTCTSDAAADKMVSQMPFFRFIIYDTLKQALAKLEVSETETKEPGKKQKTDTSKAQQPPLPVIDQTKLKSEIRLALEKALPEKGIQEIVLKNIHLS
ncbi:MAG: hypothetical protein C4522_18390 [Desulfobacteraceae bacterium]|nr:MAG: hypothetical protein C4522_18390 [Desulfobacteraceae bacterium]